MTTPMLNRVRRLEGANSASQMRAIRDDGTIGVAAEESRLIAEGFRVLVIRRVFIDPVPGRVGAVLQ